MSDVTINYKGAAISTMDASGTKTLQTQGKYCEGDIEVVYVSPGGGGTGYTLLASGSYTRTAAAGGSMAIPVTYTGTPYFCYVVADSIISGTAQSYCFMIFTPSFPGCQYLQNGKTGITSAVNSSGSIATNAINATNSITASTITCSRASNSYLIQPNTYKWYIYGTAT